MNKAYSIIKEDLKGLAKEIKELKLKFKDGQRKGIWVYKTERRLHNAKYEFRHKHIARCLLRGRDYEQIEKPAKNNNPDWDTIEKYKQEFTDLIEQHKEPVEVKESHICLQCIA